MGAYTDDTIIRFGVHKGRQLDQVPDKWFLSFWYQNQLWYKDYKEMGIYPDAFSNVYDKRRFRVCEYIEDNFEEEQL